MKFASFIALLIASLGMLAVVSAENIPFTPCPGGNGTITVKQISIDPKMPSKKGDTVTVTLSAYSSEPITSGSIKAVVKWSGVPLIKPTVNICDVVSCPLAAGPILIKHTVTAPMDLPKGRYDVNAAVLSAAGTRLACVDVEYTLAAALFDSEDDSSVVEGNGSSNSKGYHVFDGVEYDAREEWPGLIELTMDQGKCAGSYAVASASAIADRGNVRAWQRAQALGLSREVFDATHGFSAHSNGVSATGGFRPAALDILVHVGDHCRGGNSTIAFDFVAAVGIVSTECMGYGQWDSPTGPIRKCGFDESPCVAKRDGPDVELHKCLNSKVDYDKDKQLDGRIVMLASGVNELENQLRSRGTLAVTIAMHNSMLFIGDKVYRGEGSYISEQVVKLVGYGKDPVEGPYWIAINTFGTGWGVEGTFRIAKGYNIANVETSAATFM